MLQKIFASFEGIRIRYCSAPASYRNYHDHKSKRHHKIYLQFIKEHYALLKNHLNNNQQAREFLEGMLKIDEEAREIFAEAIEELEKEHPGIKKVMYGNHGELTIITKIVRYEKCDTWGTTPHFDKSGLLLIWDSNDNYDSLLLCENTDNPRLEEMKIPERIYAYKDDVTSVILIAGSVLSKVGIAIKPTLHGVAPLKKEYRYAIISFALVPDIDTSDIKTDFN